MKNYRFILADDHKGNKFLMVVKGDGNKAMNNRYEITDDRFKSVAKKLIHILEHSSVEDE